MAQVCCTRVPHGQRTAATRMPYERTGSAQSLLSLAVAIIREARPRQHAIGRTKHVIVTWRVVVLKMKTSPANMSVSLAYEYIASASTANGAPPEVNASAPETNRGAAAMKKAHEDMRSASALVAKLGSTGRPHWSSV